MDAVIFEAQPLASYGDEYLRKPIQFPQRRPGQYYINFGYEQQFYFPLYADPGFLVHIDVNMTYLVSACVWCLYGFCVIGVLCIACSLKILRDDLDMINMALYLSRSHVVGVGVQ